MILRWHRLKSEYKKLKFTKLENVKNVICYGICSGFSVLMRDGYYASAASDATERDTKDLLAPWIWMPEDSHPVRYFSVASNDSGKWEL